MTMKKQMFITAAILALAACAATGAEQPNPAEAKLREALRNSMLQLRDAQNQLTTLQATHADTEKERDDLKTQVAVQDKKITALTGQMAADKDSAAKAVADLNAKISQREGEIIQLKEVLEKWKDGYNQVVTIARTKESERAKLQSENILLQRKVEDREAKNAELFRVGSEILTRYEKFSLGDALAAKEPFVGTTRVKLENLVQDYQDKLLAQRVTSGDSTP